MTLYGLSPREKSDRAANFCVCDYLLEKQAVGFIGGVSIVRAPLAQFYEHQFMALLKYFDEILSNGLAQLCCTGNIVPRVMQIPSNGERPAWRYWAIRMYPYLPYGTLMTKNDTVSLAKNDAVSIAEHLRSGSHVLWKPKEV